MNGGRGWVCIWLFSVFPRGWKLVESCLVGAPVSLRILLTICVVHRGRTAGIQAHRSVHGVSWAYLALGFLFSLWHTSGDTTILGNAMNFDPNMTLRKVRSIVLKPVLQGYICTSNTILHTRMKFKLITVRPCSNAVPLSWLKFWLNLVDCSAAILLINSNHTKPLLALHWW